MTLIKLRYSTIDHFSETRTFKTLAGARAYFARKMGTSYDLGSSYAVDMFGTGKLVIREGTTWAELLDRPDPHGLEDDRSPADVADALEASLDSQRRADEDALWLSGRSGGDYNDLD